MGHLKIKALLIDLEGTLYFKGSAISGVTESLKQLRAKGFPMRFITNSDSKSAEQISASLLKMGLAIDSKEILSPFEVALNQIQTKQLRCYSLLPEELKVALSPYEVHEDEQPHVVIVGDVRQVCSYENLNRGFRYLINGAELLALQPGRFFVREDGYYLDTGGFIRLLEYASGVKAKILGKPEIHLFQLGLQQLGVSPTDIAVVGDDVTTDIVGARAIGSTGILVRTGKYNSSIAQKTDAEADYTIDSFPDILNLLGGDS